MIGELTYAAYVVLAWAALVAIGWRWVKEGRAV